MPGYGQAGGEERPFLQVGVNEIRMSRDRKGEGSVSRGRREVVQLSLQKKKDEI